MTYTDPKQAFADLKETFLDIPLANPHDEGWRQALAVQGLKNMDDGELLHLANRDKVSPYGKMLSAYRFQLEVDGKYKWDEPAVYTMDERTERVLAMGQAYSQRNHELNNLPLEQRLQYIRAFQTIHEYIEDQFERPISSTLVLRQRDNMLYGLNIVSPKGLIDTVKNAEHLGFVAHTLALITKETLAKRYEQQALRSARIGKGAAVASIGLGFASATVATKVDKEPSTPVVGAGLSLFGITAIVAAYHLFKATKNTHKSMQQYERVTHKILADEQTHSNYYKLKIQDRS